MTCNRCGLPLPYGTVGLHMCRGEYRGFDGRLPNPNRPGFSLKPVTAPNDERTALADEREARWTALMSDINEGWRAAEAMARLERALSLGGRSW